MKITRKVSSAFIAILLIIFVFAGCAKDNKADESSISKAITTIKSESGTTEPTAKVTTTKADVAEKTAFEKAFDHLVKSVPEVENFLKSDGTVCRFDQEPDPSAADYYEREYYQFYLGYDHEDRTERWNSFYVKRDLSDIKVSDFLTGEVISLTQWRENNTF